MDAKLRSTFFIAPFFLLVISCLPPVTNEAVIRPGSNFTKNSSLTIVTPNGDPAIFKPVIERELIKKGFNIISDAVTQISSVEMKHGELKSAGMAEAKHSTVAAGNKAEGAEVTEKYTSTTVKSDFIGKIDYIYDNHYNAVTRVDLTIINIKNGIIAGSVSYGFDYQHMRLSNEQAAIQISNLLNNALSK